MARGDVSRRGAQAAVRPVQLKTAIVAGAAADTNIAVAGIKKRDQLVLVAEFAAGGVPVDRTNDTVVQVDGQIRSSDDTAGNTLVVLFYSV